MQNGAGPLGHEFDDTVVSDEVTLSFCPFIKHVISACRAQAAVFVVTRQIRRLQLLFTCHTASYFHVNLSMQSFYRQPGCGFIFGVPLYIDPYVLRAA